MKGPGAQEWTYEEYDEAFGNSSSSNPGVWETREGKERFELALSDGLLDHRIVQQSTAEN